MTLFTKCILDEKTSRDGFRISVMSRHTLNDGLTPDSRINNQNYNFHLKFLSPSSKLLGDYYKRGLPWNEFESLYFRQIEGMARFFLIRILAKLALKFDITLMCIEKKPDKCHRRLLAEKCQFYEPKLKVVIN